MRVFFWVMVLLFSFAVAQTTSKVLNQPLPLSGATAIANPDDRILRALAVTEGKRCQMSEAWAFKQSTPGEYSKLVESSYEAFKKAGWKLEPKGNLSQGGSNVEAFKLTGTKNELVLGYWLLAGNQSQLFWCRLN